MPAFSFAASIGRARSGAPHRSMRFTLLTSYEALLNILTLVDVADEMDHARLLQILWQSIKTLGETGLAASHASRFAQHGKI
jgi:hypothetical protein